MTKQNILAILALRCPKYRLRILQAHSNGVAWDGTCSPWATGCQLFATLGNFVEMFYYYFIVEVKEKSPNSLVDLNFGLCDLQESSLFSCTRIIHLILIT